MKLTGSIRRSFTVMVSPVASMPRRAHHRICSGYILLQRLSCHAAIQAHKYKSRLQDE